VPRRFGHPFDLVQQYRLAYATQTKQHL
jgi:hypothetical protein